MNSSNKVKYAVVGCGSISSVHFKGIHNSKGAELGAVCDIDKTAGDAAAKKYDVPVYYNIEELLKQEDIDVVNICTPSSLHPEQTIAAANAGKHVLVEKPMAIHLRDISPMIQACKDNNVLLATVFPRRMSPEAIYLREIIKNGDLGELSLCSAYAKIYRSQLYYDSAGWRGTWRDDGGGAMMNQGIHTVDLLQWIVGPVASVYGNAKAVLRNIEVEDTVVSSLEFVNGAMGVLEITTTAIVNEQQRLEIHGEKGSAIFTGDSITRLNIEGEDVKVPTFNSFSVIPDGHYFQIQDLTNAILEDRKPEIGGEEGRHSLEIILGTYESSEKQQKIYIS